MDCAVIKITNYPTFTSDVLSCREQLHDPSKFQQQKKDSAFHCIESTHNHREAPILNKY